MIGAQRDATGALAPQSWQRRLRARVRTLWVLKMLSTAGGIALFFYAYFLVMRHPLGAVTVMPVIWVDELIGFQPLAFPLYAFLWVYISLGTALARNLRELVAFGLTSLAMSIAGLAFFMLLPTRTPDFAINWASHPSIQFLKRVDVAGNACPSLHAAFCVFTAVALNAQLASLGAARWLRVCNVLICVGILYSTVATRQHVALDAIAGVVLGGVASLAYLSAMASPGAETNSKQPSTSGRA
ncbi:MAG: phosphatase PAP2 family protein [Betaproteobacteria bacterium]|nr:phosphatase PAP2 family protein [Betaproteobacteria bacterium]